MPDTLEALAVVVLAVLPGAMYVWALEREIGRWGITLADRVLRFVAVSAIFQALWLPATYALRSEYVHKKVEQNGVVRFENRVASGESLPSWLALVPIVYLAIPAIAGTLASKAVRGQSDAARFWGRVLVGRDPAPRAWDFLFSPRPAGLVRMRLKNDETHPWLGGLFGGSSYAAGYPEQPQDLYLEETYQMASDGSFVEEDGDLVPLGSALLIRWEEVDLLEFFPTQAEA